MTIKAKRSDSKLIIQIEGKIDSTTAPELNDYIKSSLTGIQELEIDLEKVEYVSSAGLRSVLIAQKIMDKQGKMFLSHVRNEIMEIFELTGFTNFLTII